MSMKLKIKLTVLTPILLTLFCGIQIRSQEIPTALSAGISVVTAPASNGVKATNAADTCEERLATANARLLKALDAYEKAIALVDSKDAQIAAMRTLDGLQKEYIAVKDQMIADLQADNKFLRGGQTKSKLRRTLETLEKIGLVGAGIYLGRH